MRRDRRSDEFEVCVFAGTKLRFRNSSCRFSSAVPSKRSAEMSQPTVTARLLQALLAVNASHPRLIASLPPALANANPSSRRASVAISESRSHSPSPAVRSAFCRRLGPGVPAKRSCDFAFSLGNRFTSSRRRSRPRHALSQRPQHVQRHSSQQVLLNRRFSTTSTSPIDSEETQGRATAGGSNRFVTMQGS